MNVLEVKGLFKAYPTFELKVVSFSLEKGKITGFIGRNGAGKSTTLGCLFGFVHPDNGEINFFGTDIKYGEKQIKQRVGYVSSAVNFYAKKKLSKITKVTKSFYKNWDDAAYERYMKLFALDENKTPSALSAGMKVKYALVLALSHNADLLILDEPTSGLDPISRDELLEIFMNLCDEGKTILFSTHITSDLDRCADNIIYIRGGKIVSMGEMKSFIDSYRICKFSADELNGENEKYLIGKKRTKDGFSALIKTQDYDKVPFLKHETDLEEIMLHLEKEDAEPC